MSALLYTSCRHEHWGNESNRKINNEYLVIQPPSMCLYCWVTLVDSLLKRPFSVNPFITSINIFSFPYLNLDVLDWYFEPFLACKKEYQIFTVNLLITGINILPFKTFWIDILSRFRLARVTNKFSLSDTRRALWMIVKPCFLFFCSHDYDDPLDLDAFTSKY